MIWEKLALCINVVQHGLHDLVLQQSLTFHHFGLFQFLSFIVTVIETSFVDRTIVASSLENKKLRSRSELPGIQCFWCFFLCFFRHRIVTAMTKSGSRAVLRCGPVAKSVGFDRYQVSQRQSHCHWRTGWVWHLVDVVDVDGPFSMFFFMLNIGHKKKVEVKEDGLLGFSDGKAIHGPKKWLDPDRLSDLTSDKLTEGFTDWQNSRHRRIGKLADLPTNWLVEWPTNWLTDSWLPN